MILQTYIFYGSSGSGKGTQALLLKEYIEKKDSKHNVLYIETGARFREFMEDDNYTSKITKNVLEEGGLLPEFLPIWAWSDFLIKNYTGNEHLILDGLARRVDEAPVLNNALKFYNRDKTTILLLNVSREWSIERLRGRGRYDDIEKDINRRLDWYDLNVVPTIEFFKNNSNYNFIEINGEQTVEEVHNEIVGKLKM